MRWKPSSSHHTAIKPTPGNARILSLAPTTIVGCACITSAADDFNISSTQAPTCRWAESKHFDGGTGRPASTLMSQAPVQRFLLRSCVRSGRGFWKGGGKQKCSSIDLICAWNWNSPIYPSHLQRPASILKPTPTTPHCRLSIRKAKPLHLFGL